MTVIVKATSTPATITTPAIAAPATTGSLRTLLCHEFIELAILEHLAQGAEGKAENRDGGPQVEGLLQGPCRAHFVVAQTDAKSTALTVSTATAALTAATRITPTTFGLPPLLLGVAVGITHGPLAWNQAQV